MPILICQNPCCGKKFNGRVHKNYVSKFCSNQCSADDRKNRPDIYDKKKLGFQKGHKSWKAGTKGSGVGNLMIRNKKMSGGNIKRLRFINVGIDHNGFTKYLRYDRYLWEKANGPLPDGYVIYHKDGRTLNDEISNLECITIGEALSRYAAVGEKSYSLDKKKDVKKIIKACKANDRRVQKILFDMCYEKGMLVAMRYVKDNDSAQDILTDAFLKVFDKIETFNFEGNLEGWIMRIVSNTAIDSIRKGKKTLVMNSDDMSYFEGMSLEDEPFEFGEVSTFGDFQPIDLFNEIENLSPQYRTVINMFVFEEMSHKEISEKLGINEGTSKSNFFKAKIVLKDRIQKLINSQKNREEKVKDTCRLYDLGLI